jgi:hypothetical protein
MKIRICELICARYNIHPMYICKCAQFLLIFRKLACGELQLDNGLAELAALGSIDVTKEGVIGARNFFQAKVRVCVYSIL